MTLTRFLKTVGMVTGTFLSIQYTLYFIPDYACTMLCENLLFETKILEEAGNFSMKIWKFCKKWTLELGVGVRNMLFIEQ